MDYDGDYWTADIYYDGDCISEFGPTPEAALRNLADAFELQYAGEDKPWLKFVAGDSR
jgi:predicted RNase H-like HicB family nuclease